MSEGDLVTTLLDCEVVKNTSAQTRTDRTKGFAFRGKSFHDRVSVMLNDAERNIKLAEVRRQHFSRKSRLFLIEVHCQQLKPDWSTRLKGQQNIQKSVAVFPSRDTDHYAVAVVDHSKIGNRFAHFA